MIRLILGEQKVSKQNYIYIIQKKQKKECLFFNQRGFNKGVFFF